MVGLVFGTLIALMTPPFQAPDEHRDFLRAYQISEGRLTPIWQNNTGYAVLPASLARVIQPFAEVRFNKSTTSRGAIVAALRIPLRPKERTVYLLANGSSYPPLDFFPQAMAIAAGRALRWPPLVLMYLGRLANLWTWIALGCGALRIAPGLGRPLLLLMLMPMSLFQSASLSPDAMTNGLAFLVTALVFRAVFSDAAPIGPWLAGFLISSAALSLTKAAYFPLIGLIFLIQPRRFGGGARFVLTFLVIALASAALLLWWAGKTPGLDMVTYVGAPYVNARLQFAFLCSHPQSLLLIPLLSAQRDGLLVVLSFVGRLGWLNVQLSPFFVFGYLAALVAACRTGIGQRPLPNPWKFSAVILIVVAAAVEAVLLLNWLFWTSVGALRVDGLQGRYFIPIAAPIVLLLNGVWRLLPAKLQAHRSEPRRDFIAALVVLVSCAYTVIVLYLHYYISVAVGFV